MVQRFFRFMFKLRGWKVNPNIPPEAFKQCVVIAAPHTAWSDIIYTRAAFDILKIPIRVTVADKYQWFPLNKILESVGALWIDRSPKKPGEKRKSYVAAMTELFSVHNPLAVVVTPEGTRSISTKWKTGFYRIAKEAGVPIALGYLDYEKKEGGIGKMVYPTDDMAADMREVMQFYKSIPGKYPDKFSVDLEYL